MSKLKNRLLGIIALLAVGSQVATGCGLRPSEAGISPTTIVPASSPTPASSLPLPSLQQISPLPILSPTPAAPSPSSQSAPPGLILYESNRGSGWAIWQMNGAGTNKHIVIPFDEETYGFGRLPRWSPDGQHFAYLYAYDQDGTRWDSIWVVDRDGSDPYQIGEPSKSAAFQWSDSTTLFVYFTLEGLFIGSYDLTTGVIDEHILPKDHDDYLEYVCAAGCQKVAGIKNGEREYFIYNMLTEEKITVFEIPDTSGEARNGTWSPDGNQLAFTHGYKWGMTWFSDLYTVQANGQDLHRLTDFKAQYSGGDSLTSVGRITWSPSEEWIALTLGILGESLDYLGVIPAEGGPVTNLGIAWKGGSKPVWSPDSTKIAFVSNARFVDGLFPDPYNDLGQWDIYTVDIYTKEIQRLTNDEAMEMHIDWK